MPFCGRVVTGRRLLPVATRFMFSTIIMPMTKTTIVLLFLMSVWKGMFGGAHQIAQPKSEEVELQDYAPVGNTGGWVLLGQRLYVTDNSGTSWQDITPDGLAEARAHAILFADMRRGWVAIAKEDYTLAQTEDGGKTWRSAALPVSGDDASFAPASMQLSQTPDGALLLYIRRATSGAFRMGVWWLSADGGANWTRASEPPPLSPAGDAITTPKNLQKIKAPDAAQRGPNRWMAHALMEAAKPPRCYLPRTMAERPGKKCSSRLPGGWQMGCWPSRPFSLGKGLMFVMRHR